MPNSLMLAISVSSTLAHYSHKVIQTYKQQYMNVSVTFFFYRFGHLHTIIHITFHDFSIASAIHTHINISPTAALCRLSVH